MFGIGQKKDARPAAIHERPVKYVKIDDGIWQVVWADEDST
jgi:hypothetical protein